MELLAGVMQNYAWGSITDIAALRGLEPTGSPEAEFWLGAHPLASATLPERSGMRLIDAIDRDPERELGAAVVAQFGPKLPYLLKLLAAARPLSLQVHPSVEQAAAGFAREETEGVARSAADRTFRDQNHKPELLAALTRFEALVGFRHESETLRFFDELGARALDPIRSLIEGEGLGAVLEHLLTMPEDDAAVAVEDVVSRCAQVRGSWSAEADLLTRLGRQYPGDSGVLTAALLNRVALDPGDAIYLGSGSLHSYVQGFGVEVMSNSDNVARGGLTSKHVDTPVLLELVDASPIEPQVLRAHGTATPYPTPAAEFELTRLDSPIAIERVPRGPEMILCANGTATVTSVEAARVLGRGEVLWVSAADDRLSISGDATVFVAAVGSLGPGVVQAHDPT